MSGTATNGHRRRTKDGHNSERRTIIILTGFPSSTAGGYTCAGCSGLITPGFRAHKRAQYVIAKHLVKGVWAGQDFYHVECHQGPLPEYRAPVTARTQRREMARGRRPEQRVRAPMNVAGRKLGAGAH